MSRERLDAFHIREYTKADGTKDSAWTRIGSAWTNRDGSLNLQLNTMPLDGKVHIRKPTPRPAADNVEEPKSGPPAGEFPPAEDAPF